MALTNGTDSENKEQRIQEEYLQVKEVKFSTTFGAQGEQRICKIKCIAGQWVGPLCAEKQGDWLNSNVPLQIISKMYKNTKNDFFLWFTFWRILCFEQFLRKL